MDQISDILSGHALVWIVLNAYSKCMHWLGFVSMHAVYLMWLQIRSHFLFVPISTKTFETNQIWHPICQGQGQGGRDEIHWIGSESKHGQRPCIGLDRNPMHGRGHALDSIGIQCMALGHALDWIGIQTRLECGICNHNQALCAPRAPPDTVQRS